MAIEAEKLTGDNIYKVLIYFDKLYSVMDDQEKRQLMESLLSEVQIYEERQPNGQWLKSIKFKLPIIAEDMVKRLAHIARKTGKPAVCSDASSHEIYLPLHSGRMRIHARTRG